eukprot:2086077-Rhodomonas_salina.1
MPTCRRRFLVSPTRLRGFCGGGDTGHVPFGAVATAELPCIRGCNASDTASTCRIANRMLQ